MPKKLVCVIGSEMYANHAESRLLASQMVNNRVDQRATHIQAEVPLSTAPKPPQPTGLRVLLSRKQRTNQVSGPPPYAKVLSDAYWELSEIYQPGDEIVLFIVTGVEADWEFLRTTARVLAEHLEAGTEPTRVAPDSRSSVDSDEDIFGDRTREEPTNHMLGRRVECSLVIVYRSESRVTEINNSLLREFPLSVNQIFSFNWATGHENYCDTHRDERGQVICREVSYYKQIQWHLPAVTNATMSFIRYTPKHIEAWKSLNPSTPQTLISLPSPLTPEYPPSPTIVTPPTPPRPRFSWSMARRSTTRSGTLSSIRSPRRSSTLMSGFTTVPRSDSLMSSFTATPLVSSPMPLESFTGSPASSRSSTILTQSSNLTESSRTSMDSDFPALREAYNSLPGMTKHQVWSYPGFGKHNDDYALPERVVWRSSRE